MSWLDLSWAEEHQDVILMLKEAVENDKDIQEKAMKLNSIIVGSSSSVWKSQLQGGTGAP